MCYYLILQESVSGHKPRPVRPGMFLETVTKVLNHLYMLQYLLLTD